jgi:hypothetical protein
VILGILKLVHILFGLIGIGAGTVVLLGMFTGELLDKWSAIFLKCALAVSVTGLLFPLHHVLPTHWAAMLEIYVSGVAILAWRRFRLAGIWAPAFALSMIFTLCLNILVAIAHVFDYLPVFEMLAPTQPKLLFLITESMVMLLFAGLGIFTVKRYRNRPTSSTDRPQVNE